LDLIALDHLSWNTEWWQFTMAAMVLCGCGTVAIGVAAGLNRKMTPVRHADEPTRLTLICPVCQKKHEAAVGEGPAGQSACATCGLIFSVQARLPRCPECNYLLFMLQSDRCPECGHVITRGAVDDAAPASRSASGAAK
jgi:DNA-directed RNA polymerase subunit RPC12/RpoP